MSGPSVPTGVKTNLEIPADYPDNVQFIKVELSELFERFESKVGQPLPFTNLKKMGDVKATYGIIFDHLRKVFS